MRRHTPIADGTGQLDLFTGWSVIQPEFEHGLTLEQRAEAFHEANPRVFDILARIALDTRTRGLRRWSIAGVFEIARWEFAIATRGDEFRLNNSFRAWYARRLMESVPGLEGFFETRSAGSDVEVEQ